MGVMQEEAVGSLVGIWQVQDALLQQYRTIFITMQSIFIAVAAAVAQGAPPAQVQTPLPEALLVGNGPWIPMLLLTALAAYTLFSLWLPICRARGETVYLIQYLILKAESGAPIANPVRVIKDFPDLKPAEIVGDPMFKALDPGKTRDKMERHLPAMFVLAWIFLWLALFLHHAYIAVHVR